MRAVELIRAAYQGHYAVGQFNVYNMESIQAVARAAELEASPAFFGVSMGGLHHAGIDYLAVMVQQAMNHTSVPLLLHADHAKDIEIVRACIHYGWHSIMIDASERPKAENIALTQQVVQLCHAAGVAVEAQIGETWNEETGEGQIIHTSPQDARAFVDATGVDYLAVSVGNTPGALAGQAEIDLALVCAIGEAVDIPLVFHGGTSIPETIIRQSIEHCSVAKVNIDTAIRKCFTETWHDLYTNPEFEPDVSRHDPRQVMSLARAQTVEAVRGKMRLFGSSGKAIA